MPSLPRLGPRGEGWVILQLLLLSAVVVLGLIDGPAWGGLAGTVGAFAGLVLIGAGATLLGLGLRDLGSDLTPLPMPSEGATLVRTGAYALVRHPLYGGLMLGALGWSLLRASPLALVATAALIVFFHLKARREEAWLRERFDDYAAYAAGTCRFIPWLY